MSSPQRSVATPKPAKESRTTDGDTRRQVMLLLLKEQQYHHNALMQHR